ncbi:hypothetical protein V6N13_053253 [Hibiscus sabdariffa]
MAMFTLCLDGRYLLLRHNYLEISKFSKYDADAFPRYENQLYKFGKLMDFLLDSQTPEALHWDSSFTDRLWTRCLKHILALGQKDLMHVEGGMDSISTAISNAAIEVVAYIMTNAQVSQLMIEDSGTVDGVLLADGTKVHSSVVLSNATPHRTFLELVPQDVLPADFLGAIKYTDYNSVRWSNLEVGPQQTTTIHNCSESMDDLGSACLDAWNGLPSKRPIMEMTIPSSLDKTVSPTGKYVVGLFTQYTPYKPSDASWENPTYRESYAKGCFSLIDECAPGFSSSIIAYEVLTPPDLEREFGLTAIVVAAPEEASKDASQFTLTYPGGRAPSFSLIRTLGSVDIRWRSRKRT